MTMGRDFFLLTFLQFSLFTQHARANLAVVTTPGAGGAVKSCWHFSEASAAAQPHTAVGCNIETRLIKQLVGERIQEVNHSKHLR